MGNGRARSALAAGQDPGGSPDEARHKNLPASRNARRAWANTVTERAATVGLAGLPVGSRGIQHTTDQASSRLIAEPSPSMPNTVAKRTMPVGRPFPPGVSGNPGGSSRARKDLNADTIRAMHAAFREGGKQAIDKVMKQSPAIFLKLLVLLVPRELEVTHSGGVKAMSDEQLEAGIEAIQAMLAKREQGMVDVTPAPETPDIPETSKPPRIRRKRGRDDSLLLPQPDASTDTIDISNG